MTNSIDAKLMTMGDNKSKVCGTYFGSKFSGQVISSRQNTVTYREQITIKLDNAIIKPGNFLSDSDIIITSKDIENKLHAIQEIK